MAQANTEVQQAFDRVIAAVQEQASESVSGLVSRILTGEIDGAELERRLGTYRSYVAQVAHLRDTIPDLGADQHAIAARPPRSRASEATRAERREEPRAREEHREEPQAREEHKPEAPSKQAAAEEPAAQAASDHVTSQSEFREPMLRGLKEMGGPASLRELLDYIVDHKFLKLRAGDHQTYKTGKRRWEFVSSKEMGVLRKEGLVVKEGDSWALAAH